MSRHLVIFAKSPRSGTVKTRLQATLLPGEVRRLYMAFLRDTLNLARRVRDVDSRVIAFAPSDGEPLLRRALGSNARRFSYVAQRGSDLGERLRNALAAGFRNGAVRMIIIGADSPSLPPRLIEEAFEALDHAQIVLGPSLDGGFYLIGARKPESSSRLDFLTHHIAWSTEAVLRQTLAATGRSRLKTHLLAGWYDVDTAGSLRFLANHLAAQRFLEGCAGAPHTRRALNRIVVT